MRDGHSSYCALVSAAHVLPGLLVSSCWMFPVFPGPILLTIAVAMTAAGMDMTYDLCYVSFEHHPRSAVGKLLKYSWPLKCSFGRSWPQITGIPYIQ